MCSFLLALFTLQGWLGAQTYSILVIHSRLLIQDPPTGFLECDVSVHDNNYLLSRHSNPIDMITFL